MWEMEIWDIGVPGSGQPILKGTRTELGSQEEAGSKIADRCGRSRNATPVNMSVVNHKIINVVELEGRREHLVLPRVRQGHCASRDEHRECSGFRKKHSPTLPVPSPEWTPAAFPS